MLTPSRVNTWYLNSSTLMKIKHITYDHIYPFFKTFNFFGLVLINWAKHSLISTKAEI